MELYVQRNDLFHALEKIEGIIDIKRLLPILTHCLFIVENGSINLFSTDLSLSVITKCSAEVISSGTIVVPAKKFYELLKSFPEGNIHLKYKDINNKLAVKLSNYEFFLSCVPIEDYPSIPEYRTPDTVEFSSSFLSDIIRKIQFCITTTRQNIGLPGMIFDFKQKSIACVTTDGHRLAVGEFYMPRYSADFAFIGQKRQLSKKTLSEYIKIFSNDNDIICYLSEKGISFEQNDTVLIAKFLELNYPDYNTLIPKEMVRTYNVNRIDLINAIRATMPLASELTNSIRLYFEDNKLIVRSSDSQAGKGEVVLDVPFNYPDYKMDMEFNAFYLLDILIALSEESFEFCSQENPKDAVILRDKEMSHYTFVIMPLY